MRIRETWVNKTKGYQCGDSDWYEPFTDNIGKLYKSLTKEYGRCVSKIYYDHIIDPVGLCGPTKQISVGWVFEKSAKYEDTHEPYIQETWVEFREGEE